MKEIINFGLWALIIGGLIYFIWMLYMIDKKRKETELEKKNQDFENRKF